MSLPKREYDKHGFPLPVTFDHYMPGDQPLTPSTPNRSAAANPAPQSNSPRRRSPWIGLIKLAVLATGIAIVVGPYVVPVVRRAMASRCARLAQEKFEKDQPAPALLLMDRALSWRPDDAELHIQRAQYRRESSDLDGALEDLNAAMDDKDQAENPLVWINRSEVWQRMALSGDQPDPKMHEKAIDDANHALALCRGEGFMRATALNQLAYSRALANQQFDQGLQEIDQALDILNPNWLQMPNAAEAPADNDWSDEWNSSIAAFRDTRGFLLCKLGRYEEGLVDLNAAIAETEKQHRRLTAFAQNMHRHGLSLTRPMRLLNEELGVMHYHRSLAYEKLDKATDAKAEREQANKLGFNPKKGVF